MVERIFTFGFGQTLPDGTSGANKYVRIKAESAEEALDIMLARFGRTWAFQYPTADAAGVERYGLIEIHLDKVARFTVEELNGEWTVLDHKEHQRLVHQAHWPEDMARDIATGLNRGNYPESRFFWEVGS